MSKSRKSIHDAIDALAKDESFRREVDFIKDMLLSRGISFSIAVQEIADSKKIPENCLFTYLITSAYPPGHVDTQLKRFKKCIDSFSQSKQHVE